MILLLHQCQLAVVYPTEMIFSVNLLRSEIWRLSKWFFLPER